MSTLDAPGASIYYESVGKGPLLLCISGGDGTTEIWQGFSEELKDRFTVVSWNRRGFGKSYLTGAQDYSQRLETDSDDAARLIRHLSPNEPATVIGNSSGAIVSLTLLSRNPELIRQLISYEPPLAKLLPDFDEIWATHEDIYATYRAAGVFPAYEKFGKLVKVNMPPQAVVTMMSGAMGPYVFSNMMYWFEREFMTYPAVDFDVQGKIAPVKEKLILFNGELSNREAYQYRGNVALGKQIGVEVIHVPGEHVGHRSHPKEFGQKLVEVLKAKDEFYSTL
ncbi:hypothetical protein LTR86_010635 [Recurvomyces mirabilis]|nr:hypothetical protein LTR86_010635 [Recurvomyces mirabilis]